VEIECEQSGQIDVTIRRRSKITGWGVLVRARPKLPERSVVRRFGIPVTHPVQTLIDLATELKPLRLERAVNQADVHDLVDPEALRDSLDAYPASPGSRGCGRCSTDTRSASPTPISRFSFGH
jgi:hypothetical protein